MNTWSHLFNSRRWILKFVLLWSICIVGLKLFSAFLIWNESRPGYIFHDVILESFSAIDLSFAIALLTNIPIFGGILLMFRNPSDTVLMLCAVTFMCAVRSATLFLVPLEPPSTLIPLDDSFLIHAFYGGTSLKRDLFFSGHTANLILAGLIQNNKKIRNLIYVCALAVGLMVILQHVHYVIDVLAAPFFAVLVHRISRFFSAKYFEGFSEGVA